MSTPELKIYIELDALVDSRIGTLMRLKPEFAIKATASKEFHNRLTDDITDIIGEGFDLKQYNDAYYQRDMSTLFYSRATRMVDFIRETIRQQAFKKLLGDPRLGGLQVIVNTFPYPFDENDEAMMRRIIATSLALPTHLITFDYLPIRDMTLAWIKALDAAIIVMYNFAEWTKVAKDLPKTVDEAKKMTGSPSTIMMVPGLLATRHDYQKIMSMDRSDVADKDPFTIAKKAFAPAFALEVLPARLFSVQRFVQEKVEMTDLNKLQQDVITMNLIAGRKQENKASAIISQTEQVAEEFHETIKGLMGGLLDGDWDEFRNGLGDMVVVIWGEENVAEFPLADDLSKIMAKNLSKFDTDYVTATASLNAQMELGYKCEIRETNVNGQTYYPIITTEDGFVIDAKGQRKEYNKNKFLKSVNWSEEVFDASPNLPLPSQVNEEDLERLVQLVESLSTKFASLGMALRERMKSL